MRHRWILAVKLTNQAYSTGIQNTPVPSYASTCCRFHNVRLRLYHGKFRVARESTMYHSLSMRSLLQQPKFLTIQTTRRLLFASFQRSKRIAMTTPRAAPSICPAKNQLLRRLHSPRSPLWSQAKKIPIMTRHHMTPWNTRSPPGLRRFQDLRVSASCTHVNFSSSFDNLVAVLSSKLSR